MIPNCCASASRMPTRSCSASAERSPLRSVGGGFRLLRQPGPHVEEEVSDLVSRHELSMQHLGQATIDDRQGLIDHFELSGVGHLSLQLGELDSSSVFIVTPKRKLRLSALVIGW